MNKDLFNILSFNNNKIDPSIISPNQIEILVEYLLFVIDNKIEGDVVEFGCYVGESSKYLMKTLIHKESDKKLYVYDSFEGLPNLSEWEKNTGWTPGTLKTTENVLIDNFRKNDLPIPIIHKDWFENVPEESLPKKISFAFLDGDFYDSIYDSLDKIYEKVSDGGYIFFHDYNRIDLPGVKAAIDDFFEIKNIEGTVVELTSQLGVFVKNGDARKIPQKIVKENSLTLVTGLWDIGRAFLSLTIVSQFS